MSKKKKIIIAVSSVLVVALLITGIVVKNKINDKLYEIQTTPLFVDDETEFIVTNIMIMHYGGCIKQNIHAVRLPIQSFGGHAMLETTEEGKYYIQPSEHFPDAVYMDEEYLEFSLWLYTHIRGEILTIEDIKECIYEGNKEKNVAADAYVNWYYKSGGGGDSIKYYEYAFGKQTGKAFSQATLAEKQQFVLDKEAKQQQEKQENSTNE